MSDVNRPGCGRLNGVDAPVGAIVGPDNAGAYFAVIERDEHGVRVDRATFDDLREANAKEAPHTAAEFRAGVGAVSPGVFR